MRTEADYYLYTGIKMIEEDGFTDINPRPKYADGIPAYTKSLNHLYRSYDLSTGDFPITTLRPIAWKTAIKEILWIYQDASNDLSLLRDKYNVNYWDEWESKDLPGTIGARYGEVVRRYHLMENLLKDVKENPYGRRHIMDLWQYKELNETDGLSPCAFLTDWNVRGEYLDMLLFQRSGDMLMASGAGCINEVQYAALLIMVARHCGYKPGKFTHVIANEQIYDRHWDAAHELQRRFNSISSENGSVHLELNPDKINFYDFTIDDFKMINYNPIKPQLDLEIAI